MLASIITPTYNRAVFLEETINSVIGQSHENLEYVILDDGSSDETQSILNNYNDARIRKYHHENMGESKTVNKGLSVSRGEIVCIVNSDDPLLPDAIKEAVDFMERNPKILAFYPNWINIGPESEFIHIQYLKKYTIQNMLRDFNFGLGPGAFIRRTALDEIGFRNPDLRYTGDMELWLRLALYGELAHFPGVLATHRIHPDSASVSCRSQIPDELILVVRSILNSKKLPLNLFNDRENILSNIYSTLLDHYYMQNKHLIAPYLFFSCFYKFIYLSKEVCRFSVRLLKGFIPFLFAFSMIFYVAITEMLNSVIFKKLFAYKNSRLK